MSIWVVSGFFYLFILGFFAIVNIHVHVSCCAHEDGISGVYVQEWTLQTEGGVAVMSGDGAKLFSKVAPTLLQAILWIPMLFPKHWCF